MDDENASVFNCGITYAEGGSNLDITGTLANTGTVQIGDQIMPGGGSVIYGLNAATTVTLGGLTNARGASFAAYGSSSFAATVTVDGSVSNAGTLTIGAYSVFDATDGGVFTHERDVRRAYPIGGRQAVLPAQILAI